MLSNPCKGGLYPLPPLPLPTQKIFLSTIKPSSERWHYRLGHPAHDIVLCIIRDNNLSCSGSMSNKFVCDSCLRAEAHQLSYPMSSSHFAIYLNSCKLMSGTLLLIPSVIKSTMLASLMTSANSYGFISFIINPKFLILSIGKFLSSNLIRVVSMNGLIPSFRALAFLTMSHATCPSTEWGG
jgi:hypothetical protein